MDYYFKFFKTVEINNSFYKLPSRETFESWCNSVPDYFVFSVKANRFITHMKKLIDPKESFHTFIEHVDALGEKLGPILFQLPPGWNINVDRLNSFLEALPDYYRYTIEFRNHTWYNEEVYNLLKKKNVAFCIYELEFHTSPIEVTSNFVYIRLHGPGYKYQGSYSAESLASWARSCLEWNDAGKDVYVYFDNDQNAYAAFNAKSLQKLVHDLSGKKVRV